MKDIKKFICENANDYEFPDVYDSFKDWVGPQEADTLYEEVFSEIFNVMNDWDQSKGKLTTEWIKKELVKSFK